MGEKLCVRRKKIRRALLFQGTRLILRDFNNLLTLRPTASCRVAAIPVAVPVAITISRPTGRVGIGVGPSHPAFEIGAQGHSGFDIGHTRAWDSAIGPGGREAGGDFKERPPGAGIQAQSAADQIGLDLGGKPRIVDLNDIQKLSDVADRPLLGRDQPVSPRQTSARVGLIEALDEIAVVERIGAEAVQGAGRRSTSRRWRRGRRRDRGWRRRWLWRWQQPKPLRDAWQRGLHIALEYR